MRTLTYKLCLAVSAIVSTCCSAAGNTSSNPASKGQIYLAAACDNASKDTRRFSSSRLIVNPGIVSDQCLDLQDVINFRPRFFHVVSYKHDLYAIRMSCTDPAQDVDLTKNARGRDVGLVIGGTLVGVYGTLGKPAAEKCGLFSVENLGQAMDICLAATKQWRVSREGCATVCNDKNKDGVCVEYGR
jgi:hypothetical protein